MKSLKKQKIISRETAMKIFYQIDINKQEISDIENLINNFVYSQKDLLEQRYKELFDEDSCNIDEIIQKDYIFKLLYVFKNEQNKVDNLINKNAKNWSVERMPKVDLAILRLAICEILSENEVPTKVSINEAIELSKIYCDDKTPKFINGILGSIVNEIG